MDFAKIAAEIADTLVSASGGPITTREDGVKFVETYVRELVHAEREACAKLAEDRAATWGPSAHAIAHIIRARSNS